MSFGRNRILRKTAASRSERLLPHACIMSGRSSRFAAALLCAITTSTPSVVAARVPGPPAAAPAAVSAVPGNGRVRLSWTPVPGATGYKVFRGANGAWDPAAVTNTRGTTHISQGLVNGTTYSFTVAAYTRGGDGPLSLAVVATPLAPPSSVIASPGDQRVTLTWQPAAGAASYTVYRRLAGEPGFSEFVTGVLAPPFVDPRLTNGTRYYYQLRAVGGGTLSDLSERVSAVPK
jgi:hypothetical protein